MTTRCIRPRSEEGLHLYPGRVSRYYPACQSCPRICTEHNYLGSHILGTDFSFDIDFKKGGGSYVVGDETALLNSSWETAGTHGQTPVPYGKGVVGKTNGDQ
jgi:NADH:ubiquinone oxidoreductase subunit F (NADH-binding)